jgi:hypothetical protein
MMVGFFQWVVVHQKQIPERFVMALEMAKAVQTPLAPPDMSSPSSSFANLSFINSTSESTVCLFSLFSSHMNRSLLLFNSDDEGEGSPLGRSVLPRGQPKGDDPSELLATSSPCVCLKLISPSPSICSEANPSVLMVLDPSMLCCSYLSSVDVGVWPCNPAAP